MCLIRIAQRSRDLPGLDVLRTIPEALRYLNHEALRANGVENLAIEPITPPGRELDPQHPDRRAMRDAGASRIAGAWKGGNGKNARVGRGDESDLSLKQRRPG